MHSDTENLPSLDGIYRLPSYLDGPIWRTLIWIKGVRVHLGDFDNYEDAVAAKERYMRERR
jgi:hypothetical protein